MATVSLVPILMVFIIFQKHLVQGISTTGLKS
jgi:pectin-derived oligosaccharide transport system permease protein